jgi:hypothetical protein
MDKQTVRASRITRLCLAGPAGIPAHTMKTICSATATAGGTSIEELTAGHSGN